MPLDPLLAALDDVQGGDPLLAALDGLHPLPSHQSVTVDRNQWDLRPDGSRKSDGYLGVLVRPDGGVMSEFSIADSENPKLRGPKGEYLDYPTLVPTLTRDEVGTLLHLNLGDDVPESIKEKAEAHALGRLAKGEPVFAQRGEQRFLYPEVTRANAPVAARPSSGDPFLDALDAVQQSDEPTDKRSLLAKAYDATFSPPDVVTRGARVVADAIDQPSVERSPLRARLEGFAGGAVQGAANLLTPGDVTLTALGVGPLARALGAVRGGAEAVRGLQQAANVATMARGAERLADAESLPEGAAGLAQIALGGAGTMASRTPTITPPVAPDRLALPPGARFAVAPDGRVGPAGVDIPMTPADDGSFVRGVPAEYARHEIRGELPPGPRFRADASGHVAEAGDADALLAALDEVQQRVPDASSVRSVPAAAVDREINPHVNARESVRVRQYSGDVDAESAPFVDEAQRQQLERMREDLREFTPQHGRLVRNPQDETTSIYAPGMAGSPVADDVRIISGQHVSNAAVGQAVDDLLAGHPPTNKLHTAVLDAAQGYTEGRPGYRGPHLPMDRVEASRGGAPVSALDDFAHFEQMFEDVEPGSTRSGREPGEEGFVTPSMLLHVAGGAAGATAGVASGEDTSDKIRRGLIFGALGAAAPSLLRRISPGAVPGVIASVETGAAGKVPGIVSGPVRSGEPMREPLAGTDVFLSKFSNPLVRDGIRERLVQNAGYADQRRGVISSEDLGRFADEVRINVARTLPKGTALNAEQITAYARGLAATQQRVSDLAATVGTPSATDADLVALQAAKADADVLTKSLMGARGEAGRALAAFNLYQSVLESGDVNLMRDVLRAPGARADAERLAQQVNALPKDPVARYAFLRNQQTSSLVDKARSVYYANILSGVKTHERNILGNVSNLAAALVTHPVAAGVDALRSMATGSARTVRLDELPSQVVGAVAGLDRGFRDAAFTLRHGVSPDRLTQTVGAAAAGSKFDVPRVELTGGAANPFNWPGRALDAGDTLFRSIARNLELYGLAHAQAKAEGVSGQRFLDRVADLRAGLTPEGAAIRQHAEAFATRAVFQEQPGRIVSAYQHIVREVPALSLVTPFIKTPANILRQGLEFSPAGALMQAARQGGREGAQAQARAVLGTAAAGYLFWLAASNRLSGNGPSDPAQRAGLMESGWRPNSVRVGDSWVSYQLLQPLAVQMSLVGNAVEAWREAGADSGNGADVAAKTFAKSIGSFLDQSFVSGLFDFVEAVNDPERSATRFAGRLASSAVPFSAAVRTVQQGADAVVRQPETIAENLKAGIPGLSTSVEPRISRFGEPVVREGGPLRRALDPLNTSSVVTDPIARELDRLGVPVSLPSDRLVLPGGHSLTPEQDTAVKERRGQMVRRAFEHLMADPRYVHLDDAGRTRAIDRLMARTRSQTSTALRRQLSATAVPGIVAR